MWPAGVQHRIGATHLRSDDKKLVLFQISCPLRLAQMCNERHPEDLVADDVFLRFELLQHARVPREFIVHFTQLVPARTSFMALARLSRTA